MQRSGIVVGHEVGLGVWERDKGDKEDKGDKGDKGEGGTGFGDKDDKVFNSKLEFCTSELKKDLDAR